MLRISDKNLYRQTLKVFEPLYFFRDKKITYTIPTFVNLSPLLAMTVADCAMTQVTLIMIMNFMSAITSDL